jgi:hypothetical protein
MHVEHMFVSYRLRVTLFEQNARCRPLPSRA